MIHTYNIGGMSCDGCRSTVEKALNTIHGIKASVTLEPPVAKIEMDKTIPTARLQEVIKTAGNYSIEMGYPNGTTHKTEESLKVKTCC